VYGPTRLVYALRPRAPLAIVAATAASAVMFAATPFVLTAVQSEFGISVGTAGRMSVAQVGGFAITTLALPRLVEPSGRVLRLASLVLVGANVVSIAAGSFPALLAFRFIAGIAAGALTWLAWGDAMRSPRTMTSVASVGPIVAIVAAPTLTFVSDIGYTAIWIALGLVGTPGLFLRFRPQDAAGPRAEPSGSRSNLVVLAVLFVVTLGGSSLFVFAAVAAEDVIGISSYTASLGYSLNAAAGFLGARLAHRHRRPGLWFASAGPAMVLAIVPGNVVLFLLGMSWWGFAWWMALPGALRMLAERSLLPDERAGHAQGLMAIGRAVSPMIGGAFADAGAYGALSVVAGSGLFAGGGALVAVQEGRDRLPPTDPRVAG
jgi:predicted MFS family arabinose efflux permease